MRFFLYIPWSATVPLLQDVLIETPLRGDLSGVVVGTDSELKVSHVVGREFHPHLDGLAPLVLAHQNALAVHPAGFVGPWL